MADKFRYKTVEFLYNPKSFQCRRERRLVRLFQPGKGSRIQDLGGLPAVISGEGELFGKTAPQDYQTLLKVFREGGCGVLKLPGLPAMQAYFASLGLLRKAGPDVFRYDFEFWEETEEGME